MPTYEATPRFTTDHHRLTPEQRQRFRRIVTRAFVPDLRAGQFRNGLRIKRVRCAPGVYELTWDRNGRATWSYGKARIQGKRHIVWHRIGTHDILSGP
ncbi:hypothetical protein ACIOJ9_39340 [Streptomyces sp. NPDC088175]|uniref:hypothetical protein n=1 Tax=unclassified Streptomyces TaxID=2593676 RepID=UPI0037F3C3C7